jgi:hypothetical protein
MGKGHAVVKGMRPVAQVRLHYPTQDHKLTKKKNWYQQPGSNFNDHAWKEASKHTFVDMCTNTKPLQHIFYFCIKKKQASSTKKKTLTGTERSIKKKL